MPVTLAMRQDLLKARYLHGDETTVPVQIHDGRGAITKCIYGRTASREERRCSTSALMDNARVRIMCETVRTLIN
jgi:hypothetical protein